MGYYKAKSGVSHRMPDEYLSDWDKGSSPGDWWEWWHIGYEDGMRHVKWEYGINDIVVEKDGKPVVNELERLQQENEALRNLLSANVRVIKEELRKELSADTNSST
jgi:hypothetical protein